ncbi:alpha/beta hydrolase-fold protein [Tsukamurella tyrosinosolvens]|uniref:alpha/beta hydrolase-fold protein n=1 Tax=Tsukamurella tyrosinosolvens TaxID=57704 RepID=UPI000DF6D161|nr:alpha/beta hydrolase-fold protein [Tsukamurella tyrosinosolvens]RDB49324.1 hypothetical protein DVB87_03395 [Tsukamurella tyrosinosolvens]
MRGPDVAGAVVEDRHRLHAVQPNRPGEGAASQYYAGLVGVFDRADEGSEEAKAYRAELAAENDRLAAKVLPVMSSPGRVTIAGQSLGGLAALAFSARHPEFVDDVLAYSPSIWWRPGLTGRPVDVAERQDWIHDRIATCPAGAFSVRLASGAFEEELTPGVADLATTARRAGHDVEHTVYSGGHDEAQWAAFLLEHLAGAP